jgi:hypothetical protein
MTLWRWSSWVTFWTAAYSRPLFWEQDHPHSRWARFFFTITFEHQYVLWAVNQITNTRQQSQFFLQASHSEFWRYFPSLKLSKDRYFLYFFQTRSRKHLERFKAFVCLLMFRTDEMEPLMTGTYRRGSSVTNFVCTPDPEPGRHLCSIRPFWRWRLGGAVTSMNSEFSAPRLLSLNPKPLITGHIYLLRYWNFQTVKQRNGCRKWYYLLKGFLLMSASTCYIHYSTRTHHAQVSKWQR